MEKKCNNSLELDLDNEIDRYDYHDAQSIFYFTCEKDDNHDGMHMAKIDGQKIYWE